MCIFNQNNLNCLKVASKNDSRSRPEFSGVLFKKDKTVATDGFSLIEMSTPVETVNDYSVIQGKHAMQGFKPFIADRKSLEAVKLPRKTPTSLPVFSTFSISHRDNEKVEFMVPATLALQEGKVIDGTFPDYERLFPKGKPVIELTINADYLKNMLDVMGKLNDQITLKIYGSEKPVVLECSTSEQYSRSMIMPVRK